MRTKATFKWIQGIVRRYDGLLYIEELLRKEIARTKGKNQKIVCIYAKIAEMILRYDAAFDAEIMPYTWYLSDLQQNFYKRNDRPRRYYGGNDGNQSN